MHELLEILPRITQIDTDLIRANPWNPWQISGF